MSDETIEITSLLRQVRLALQTNDIPSALYHLRQLVALSEIRQEWGAAARHLGNLALTYMRAGQVDEALASFERGLELARRDDDTMTEAGLLGNMGGVLREIGRLEDAITCLNEALAYSQALGDLRGRGLWLTTLGLVYDDRGQPEAASPCHMEAVKLAMQLEDRSSLAARLGNLGNTLILLGRFEPAMECFTESADLYQALDRKQDAALRLGIMGNLYAQQARHADSRERVGWFANALEHYRDSALLAHELHDYPAQADLARSMGRVLAELGQREEAHQFLQVAASIFTQLGQDERLSEVNQLMRDL